MITMKFNPVQEEAGVLVTLGKKAFSVKVGVGSEERIAVEYEGRVGEGYGGKGDFVKLGGIVS
jgi:hypothetical protein